MKDEKLELLNKKGVAPKHKAEFAIKIAVMAAGGGSLALAFMIVGATEGLGMVAFAIISGVAFAIMIFIFTVAITLIIVGANRLFEDNRFPDLLSRVADFIKNSKTNESKIATPSRYKLLRLSEVLFSAKTQKEIFLPAMADWDEEVNEALKKNKNVNLFMINARNTYAFIVTMWLKSPVGDLFEFIRKIAK